MDFKKLAELARRLADALPKELESMRADLESNFRSMLRAAFERMDLVTREEFEVQQSVLERTRERLEALEAKLAAMETDEN